MKELVKYPLFYEHLPLKLRGNRRNKVKTARNRRQKSYGSSILANR